VLLYFNDTHWEHPDLYRFLADLEQYFQHPILHDDDGRNPEELFYDHNALANDRMPFCSHVLKAERLQKFYRSGDTLIFGIGRDEPQRALRLTEVYRRVAEEKRKPCTLRFPLISEGITKADLNQFLRDTGIAEPLLYQLGFTHNNCFGGCVRAGKKHWKLLYEKLPEVYAERERVEEEVREFLGKDVSFFKDETLRAFRGRIERGELSHFYDDVAEPEVECIGICATIA